MKLFYDFETSTSDFLGQILSYSFILVDDNLTIQSEFNGLIKPNRLELPSAGAILTNKLSIQTLMNEGIPEIEAAEKIFNHLTQLTDQYETIPLIGFNSANFDFKHFEKLLLKYGFSPTFFGKLKSGDILQFARHTALQHPNTFPLVRTTRDNTPTFSFKLEDLAQAFNCLDAPQTHDARDDVLLTIELTKAIEQTCNVQLSSFLEQQTNTTLFEDPDTILIEDYFVFEQPYDQPIIHSREWAVIGKAAKTTFLLLNLTDYHQQQPTELQDFGPITKYLNLRTKAFLPTTKPMPSDIASTIKNDPNIQTMSNQALQYFKMFPVDWDIEYRPWAMGFDNIDILRNSILELQNNMNNHSTIISKLVQYRNNVPDKKESINFMITLFNRFYLNYHPSPPIEYCIKYIHPRYIQGIMFRNPDDALNFDSELNAIQNHLTTLDIETIDFQNMMELYDRYHKFKTTYNIETVAQKTHAI